MADYTKPTQDLPIFDSLVFLSGDQPLTQNQADKRYLRYPNAQGTENLQTTNVNGILTANLGVKTDTVTSIGSKINLTAGVGGVEITNQLINMNLGTIENISKLFYNSFASPMVFEHGQFDGQFNYVIDGILTCWINGSGLNMNQYEISNVAVMSGSTNQNLVLQALGTGHIQLIAGMNIRLAFRDTGECLANSNGLKIQGTTPAAAVVSIGNGSGTTQGAGAIAIGGGSGISQGADCIAIGKTCGTLQGINSIAMGLLTGEVSQGTSSIAIGVACGRIQSNNCITMGNSAGRNQALSCIAIGTNAGFTSQGANCVAIGTDSGKSSGLRCVAIGSVAASSAQGNDSVAIGSNAGQTSQGTQSVAIGLNSATNSQNVDCVAIGNTAGNTSQGRECIAIGRTAGQNNQSTAYSIVGDGAIAIGSSAGTTSQGVRGLAIGGLAGNTSQGYGATSLGYSCGRSSQGTYAVAIGNLAGDVSQRSECVAIGLEAGKTNQGTGWGTPADGSVAIGPTAGATNQSFRTVAIGGAAGTSTQGVNSVAIGYAAGNISQGVNSVAIGGYAGLNSQKSGSVSIGMNAGLNSSLGTTGVNSIYIGNGAGSVTTRDNSIVLSASSTAFNPATSGFFVNPVRAAASTSYPMYWNTTGELTYLSSSERYKKDINDLNEDTSILYKLRPRTFKYISDGEDGKISYGFIAEELEEQSPILVGHNELGQPESIFWDRINLFSICEVQKLRKELDANKNEMNEMKTMIKTLIDEINILKGI